MKVLLVAPMMIGSKGEYIARALADLSHDVVTYDDWNYGARTYTHYTNFKRVILSRSSTMKKYLIDRMNSRFLSLIKEVRPELILIIRGDMFFPEILEAAKRITNAPLVNWFPDSLLNPNIGNFIRTLPLYDRFFMNDSYSLEILRRYGFNNLSFLPQCCEPSIHKTIELTSHERVFFGSDVAYVGSIIPLRTTLFERLSDYDLKIWIDRRWLKVSRESPLAKRIVYYRAFGLDQTRVFNASRINLNPIQPAAVQSVNLRTFEIAGSGGFQLVELRDEIKRYFKPDKEIVTYRSIDELREKIDYYLQHDRERKEIAQRGQERAYREHTYRHRLKELFDLITG